jgi:hypothetical protein
LSERPEHQQPRRLADWINPTGARKAHSLIDKVYKRKNLEMAWKKVKANRGAGGVDGESIEAFDKRFDERLSQLHEELKADTYQPEDEVVVTVREKALTAIKAADDYQGCGRRPAALLRTRNGWGRTSGDRAVPYCSESRGSRLSNSLS